MSSSLQFCLKNNDEIFLCFYFFRIINSDILFLFAIEIGQRISKANKILPLQANFLHCQATLVLDIKIEFLF